MAEVLEKPKTSVDRFRLRRLLEELERKEGRGTELISLYIPPGRNIGEVMSDLRKEHSTAGNIKSKSTRKNVQNALESIMQRLKYFRKAPDTGLVVFCGAIPRAGPGTEKIETYLIIPPEPVPFYLYRCDSKFYVAPLKEMIKEKDAYGLIVIDRNEATIALLVGRRIEIAASLTSGIPGKHDQGGQSQRRFSRIIEQLAHEFYKRVGEKASNIFLELEDNLKGVIIGGPGPTKQEFADGDYLDYRLKKKILGVVDIGYSGEEGIYELVRRGEELIKESRYVEERQLIQKFMAYIAKKPDLVTYGIKEVLDALDKGVAELVLISEDVDLVIVDGECRVCGKPYHDIVSEKSIRRGQLKCPDCGGDIAVSEVKSLVDVIDRKAKATSTRVEVISTVTPEGQQFKNVFGGIAALLRYKIS